MQTSALAALDRSHLIHPVASFREHEELGPIILKSGQGAYLTDHQDKQLLDAFSGLWCVNTGYGQESVIRAATEQMQRLPYATGYFHFASNRQSCWPRSWWTSARRR
jgi:adenosylmethionine-8-amino-7-oxononanoate aminotransferase